MRLSALRESLRSLLVGCGKSRLSVIAPHGLREPVVAELFEQSCSFEFVAGLEVWELSVHSGDEEGDDSLAVVSFFEDDSSKLLSRAAVLVLCCVCLSGHLSFQFCLRPLFLPARACGTRPSTGPSSSSGHGSGRTGLSECTFFMYGIYDTHGCFRCQGVIQTGCTEWGGFHPPSPAPLDSCLRRNDGLWRGGRDFCSPLWIPLSAQGQASAPCLHRDMLRRNDGFV